MNRPGLTVLSLLGIILIVIGAAAMLYAFNYWLVIPVVLGVAVILISWYAQRQEGPRA